MYRKFSPMYRKQKNVYKAGEAGTPDLNTGGAGTLAKPA